MATDYAVVIPTDLGTTLKLGVKEQGKYDVDISQLDLPASITAARTDTSAGKKEIVLATGKGDVRLDISPLLPAVVTEIFLKSVTRDTSTNELVFTVGERGTTTNDTVLRVSVADLLPVVSDGVTVSGNGTAGSKLAVRISTAQGNLLKSTAQGLVVNTADVQTIARNEAAAAAPARTIRLTNATGTQVVGYAYSTEQ